MNARFFAQCKLRVRAGNRAIRVNAISRLERLYIRPNGFDDACREAIREASKTLRGISSFWIKKAEVVVENDRITMFRVNGKISFLVEAREEETATRRVA